MTIRLPYRVYLYFAAQSINLTTAVMSVTMAAIVGAALADTPSLATLPYGFQFLFVMLATYPASRVMSSFGRRSGFLIGNLLLACSGILGFYAVQMESFLILTLAHSALGIYIAFANFNRFAATDGLNAEMKPKAISLVVAGGVLAAFIGPVASEALREAVGFHDFSLSYGFFTVLAAISMAIAVCLPRKDRSESQQQKLAEVKITSLLMNKHTLLAITLSSVGYGMMNLLMVQASLHMKEMNMHFANVNSAIQWHVLAMFIPSFFTGKLISRFGNNVVLYGGLLMLMSSIALNLLSASYLTIAFSLVVLGLGWNFTYVGGGALLTKTIGDSPQAMKIQGINDLGIAILATAGAFSPSFLLAWIGWSGTNILCAVICLAVLVSTVMLLSNKTNPSIAVELSK